MTYKLLSLFFLFNIHSLLGQKALLKGHVKDVQTGEYLPLSSIYIKELNKWTVTKEDGTFSFKKLPIDTYTLTVSYTGFDTKIFETVVTQDTSIIILLNKSITQLNEVQISSNIGFERISKPAMSISHISKEQLLSIPSVGGEKDIIKALMLTPGVKTESEGSTGIYVRGGSQDQNLYLLNNVPLYSSNHLFGFISSFNSDIIKNVELYKGAFPARYGGRLSSILSVESKEGNFNNKTLDGGIGLLASKLTISIPIKKDKASIIISGRRSYLDLLGRLANSLSQAGITIYNFYDVNARMDYQINYNNRINIFIYGSKDKIALKEGKKNELTIRQFNQYWQNNLSGFQWQNKIGKNIKNILELNISQYSMGLSSLTKQGNSRNINKFDSKISDIGSNYTFNYALTSYKLKLGVNYIHHNFSPAHLSFEDEDRKEEISELPIVRTSDLACFIENEFSIGQFNANAGFRFSNFKVQDINYNLPEPRLSISYSITSTSSLKAGYYSTQQPIHLLSNPGLGIPVDLWVPSTKFVLPQNSNQISVGFNKNIQKGESSWIVGLEGYYKNLKNIIAYKDGYSSSDFLEFKQGINRNWESFVTRGSGESYGNEIMVEKISGKLKGWIGYTLSWTKNKFKDLNNGESFYPRQDKRHELSIVGFYQLSNRWSLNGTWIFSSGQPITIPIYTYALPEIDLVDGDIKNSSTPLYSQSKRNTYRMKAFHKLDLSIQRKTIHKWGSGVLELSVYNVYNRKNPYYYYLGNSGIKQVIKSVSLFPVIPTISYSFKIN